MIEFVFGGVALVVSYVLLFYNYYLTGGRKALIYYALAWLSLSVPFFVRGGEAIYIVGLAFFASLLWLGNIRASDELLLSIPYAHELRYFAVVPLAAVLFLFPEHVLYSLIVLAGCVAFSGAFLLFANNESLPVAGDSGGGLCRGPFPWGGYFFAREYVRLTTALFALFLAYVSIKAFLDSSFIGEFEPSEVKLELNGGLTRMPSVPDDVLDGALVFSRTREERPNWFWITKLSGGAHDKPNEPRKDARYRR